MRVLTDSLLSISCCNTEQPYIMIKNSHDCEENKRMLMLIIGRNFVQWSARWTLRANCTGSIPDYAYTEDGFFPANRLICCLLQIGSG